MCASPSPSCHPLSPPGALRRSWAILANINRKNIMGTSLPTCFVAHHDSGYCRINESDYDKKLHGPKLSEKEVSKIAGDRASGMVEPAAADLASLTVPALKELAEEKGIEIPGDAKKADILALLS